MIMEYDWICHILGFYEDIIFWNVPMGNPLLGESKRELLVIFGWSWSIPILPLPSNTALGHPDDFPQRFGSSRFTEEFLATVELPSGKLTVCYWKLPFIVDFPIKNGDFPYSYVSLPEGNQPYTMRLCFGCLLEFHSLPWKGLSQFVGELPKGNMAVCGGNVKFFYKWESQFLNIVDSL